MFKYLQRIITYDTRDLTLNSLVLFNGAVFEEAAASDCRRANGHLRGPLDGIPYTLKNSMRYKGMTCATGSPALDGLVANNDSFVAGQLRKAGAILIGLTNTPPMMASGMHRGLYGRAESPYNGTYLAAAFSSGSSNGSAAVCVSLAIRPCLKHVLMFKFKNCQSTAASFAAFGLGSETVSSGRSPASNNALVAYTPSRTVISPRGTWPLYPTCDVLVPHTRTMRDMLLILDHLAVEDDSRAGDFWREQHYVEIPKVRRPPSYGKLTQNVKDCLRGIRIAVPRMYIGKHDSKAKPVQVAPGVVKLWTRACSDLEALGATVIETDFPLVTNYEDDSVSGQPNNVVGSPLDWNEKERGELVAFSWDDFLKENADPKFPDLASVDGEKIFPRPKGYIPDQYLEVKNFMNYPKLVEIASFRNGKSIWEIDGLAEALPALESQRKRDLEGWMDSSGIDLVVFPANGDVGKADLDTNDDSARHALLNGVKYSNGNRAIRHMGVPTVSVTMGLIETIKMPVNLTFAGKHGQDADLLRYAFAFEQQSKRRIAPTRTPPLDSDSIDLTQKSSSFGICSRLQLRDLRMVKSGERQVTISGRLDPPSQTRAIIELYITGTLGVSKPAFVLTTEESHWRTELEYESCSVPKVLYGGFGEGVGKIIALIRAHSEHGTTCKLLMLPQDAEISA